MKPNGWHLRTSHAVFEEPVSSDVKWIDIESLLIALEAELSEGRGSRVRVHLEGLRAVFHRPHPEEETGKGALKAMRRFLTEAGVNPKE